MDQKGFSNIIMIVFIGLFVGAGAYFFLNRPGMTPLVDTMPTPTSTISAPVSPSSTTTPTPIITPRPEPETTVCIQDAKQCPDGSYVGRTGKNCTFVCPAAKPVPVVTNCTKDSDCLSGRYVCEATQGAGTACSSNDASCVPTYTIIKGDCKLKTGNGCTVNSDCVSGNLCHNNTCVSPIGSQCSGPSDTNCPADYTCVQGCGAPVVRLGDPAPGYACQLKGYSRMCPICLAFDTMIDTPAGAIPVQQLQKGMSVWTTDTLGERVAGIITMASKTPVPPTHQMVKLVLDDGRTVLVSPGHSTVDGRTVGDLVVDNFYDGVRVRSVERTSYGAGATYDLLPSGETGFYWANGILLDSTLH